MKVLTCQLCLSIKEQSVEECDATKLNAYSKAGIIIIPRNITKTIILIFTENHFS